MVIDNSIIVTTWSAKHTQQQIYIAELYDRKQDQGPLQLLFGKHPPPLQSSSTFDHPQLISKSYILPTSVRSLGVSATRKGITTRGILLGLANGQLYMLSKTIATARRSDPTDTTQEEGLPLYTPLITFSSTHVISYTHTIGFIRGITSTPTERESTSLVLAIGLDIFFTPIQPAMGFDVISPNFDYAFLGVAVLLIGVALVVTTRLANSTRLNAKWK
eukprot:GHVR01029367.1.p1 GENE.GHVR01029367.1~~GHVR01029367.1.p1  ORF type:complete len:218 (-),score=40.34 GHVR01029367.1:171-824(-)